MNKELKDEIESSLYLSLGYGMMVVALIALMPTFVLSTLVASLSAILYALVIEPKCIKSITKKIKKVKDGE